MSDPQPAQRSWLEVRWRQFKNPPQPVFRAVTVNLAVAIIGGLFLFIYALAAPAADLAPWIVLYIAVVVVLAASPHICGSSCRRRVGRTQTLGLGGRPGLFRGRPDRLHRARGGLPGSARPVALSAAAPGVRFSGGGVAQRLEQTAYIRPVPGSNPGSPTIHA